MTAEADFLYFPTEQRRKYQNIGGIMLTAMGLLVLLYGYFTDTDFAKWVAIASLVPGIIISGLRRETTIDCVNKEVQHTSGFHFLTRSRQFFNGDFDQVIVRKTVSTVDHRSDIGGPNTRRLQASYAVLLKGQDEIQLDSSSEKNWRGNGRSRWLLFLTCPL